MNNRLIKNDLSILCMLAGTLMTTAATADWSGNQSQQGYNPGYGDFPPEDIEQRLFGNDEAGSSSQSEESKYQSEDSNSRTQAGNTGSSNTQSAYSTPDYQQPDYNRPGYQPYGAARNATQPYYNQAPGYSGYNRGMSFNGPWNNNNWNNNGSNFSAPWNNNGSSFNMPWGNNGSNFSGPWNNNGSSFSMPWGNSRGTPWGGNGGGWGW